MSQSSVADVADANARPASGVRLRKRPGPKPGTKHSGSFTGPDDPRICRSRKDREEPVIARAQKLAALHIEESTELLVKVMRDDTQPVKVRVDCALHLQARAAGSVVSINAMVDMTERNVGGMMGGSGNGAQGKLQALASSPSASLTDAELVAVINGRETGSLNGASDDPIEGSFEDVTPQMAANKAPE